MLGDLHLVLGEERPGVVAEQIAVGEVEVPLTRPRALVREVVRAAFYFGNGFGQAFRQGNRPPAREGHLA